MIGLLFPSSAGAARALEEPLRGALLELGYVEGQTIVLERRYADGSDERLAALAGELVRLKVDAIVAPASSATLAAKRLTSRIPIIFASANDPVGLGLVVSLARPGQNVTGVTPMSADLSAKRLELLKETLPGLARVGVLSVSTYPQDAREALVRDVDNAAKRLRLHTVVLEVARRGDLDPAFAAMVKERVGAVTVLPIAFLTGERHRIAELALRHRLPSIFHWKEYVEAGGLMSYGATRGELMRRAAGYVDRILKGTPPSDLPVERATTFELVVNLRTAKALGLGIPPPVLLRADHVIE